MKDRAQKIMDRAYGRFQSRPNMSMDEFSDSWDAEERVVVPFGNFNYQVENGGFLQWDGNGYAERDLSFLLRKSSGHRGPLGAVHRLLVKFKNRRQKQGRWDDEDRVSYDDLDRDYYKINQDELWNEVVKLADGVR